MNVWRKRLIGLRMHPLSSRIRSYLQIEKQRGVVGYLRASSTFAPSSLDELAEQVALCKKCSLCQTRTQTVFSDGDYKARLMFVGEAPGQDEDLQGKPFVGRAGQLLTKIIEAMHLKRSDVYIANVLKCRPPNNRSPHLEEIQHCSPYLFQQIQMVQPEMICALGTFAAQTILKTDRRIGELRGKFYDYQGIAVLATYHPSYLLRNPEAKRDVWQDMQKIMKKLGI